jgi:CMP-N,N'-diacetyllegionaminic acid synthase
MTEILALIPARGGSKGIPGKNIMEINGKPLISYSILQAIESKHINRVIVSTDDEKILQVSKDWGAEAPFLRPVEFAQDMSSDIEVFKHALLWLQRNENYQPDLVVHLRPTGPVREVAKIDHAVEKLLENSEADSLRAVSLASQTPYKMWAINDNGLMDPLLKIAGVVDCQSLPRQTLPKVYWQNGYVDIVRPEAILNNDSMWGENVIPLFIEEHIKELDYPEDIPEIEKALKNKQEINFDTTDNGIDRHSV